MQMFPVITCFIPYIITLLIIITVRADSNFMESGVLNQYKSIFQTILDFSVVESETKS
jgi:hypothetical protein